MASMAKVDAQKIKIQTEFHSFVDFLFEDNSSHAWVLLVFATDEFAWHVFQFYVFGLQIWEEKKRSQHGSILSIFKTSKLVSSFPTSSPKFSRNIFTTWGEKSCTKDGEISQTESTPPPKKKRLEA